MNSNIAETQVRRIVFYRLFYIYVRMRINNALWSGTMKRALGLPSSDFIREFWDLPFLRKPNLVWCGEEGLG